jgi:TLD
LVDSSYSALSEASFVVQKDKAQIASDVLFGMGTDTTLLKSEEEVQFVLDQIRGMHDGVKLKRRYLMSRDGKRAIEFHRKCDNKGPTVTLIRTKTGIVCGGYTS